MVTSGYTSARLLKCHGSDQGGWPQWKRTGSARITDEADRVERVALALDNILEHFDSQKDSDELRLLIVVEEAHLWTLKEVGRDAIKFLDKAVRMLRKKGVGVMLVSHKMTDFDPTMRSSMNISILFRTKYQGDIDSISRMLGSEFSNITPALPVGYSIFHLADLGDPFVVAATLIPMTYRPLLVVIGLLSNIIGNLVIITTIQKHHLYGPSGALARIMHPKIGKLRDFAIVIFLVIIAGLFLYLFNSQQGIAPTRTSATETATSPPKTAAQETPSPPKTTETERFFNLPIKTLNQRGLTVKVTPYTVPYSQEVKFKINFDTHSGSLDFDVTQVAFLEDDSGNMYKPKGWDGSPPGGHHREGNLSFPQLSGEPNTIRLVMKSICGADWTFEWKLDRIRLPRRMPKNTLVKGLNTRLIHQC